jgi:hypothetical protein
MVRSLHDVGLAAWFGGSLMGAIGVNGAANDVPDPRQRLRAANAGWGRWSPVNAAAIGAHLFGAVGLLRANRGRVAAQAGVGASSTVKSVLTGAAVAATAYSGAVAKKLAEAGEGDPGGGAAPVHGGAVPAPETPPAVAAQQQRLRLLQWLIPALTGGVVVVSALQGEQQRPAQQAAGLVRKARRQAVAAA